MKTLPIHPDFEPEFVIGQTVWFITSRREVESDQIRSISFKSMRSGGKESLLCVGYQLNAINPKAADRETFLFCDLFETEAMARQLTAWHPVGGVNEDEWLQVIGDREKETIEDCELGICCAGISGVRDLLIQCRQDGGLIKRDSRKIATLLRGSGHADILDIATSPKPILRNIFSQLGIILALQET